MRTTYLETWKESEKSKIYLIYDQERRCMAVEKHLAGHLDIYKKLRELIHPYLPKIYSVEFEKNETVVIEEYITGGSLEKISARKKQLKQWFFEVCDVLSFLHGKGILHRDLKPSNILLGADGHIRLIDFDAARQEKPGADSDTRLLGTRGYAPPEQYGFSQTDERSDIYALGVTFTELLGKTSKKGQWKPVLRRCTAMDPNQRFRHVWQIRVAMTVHWTYKRVLYPVVATVTALFVFFALVSYDTDMDFREAINIVLRSRRSLIFEHVDMGATKSSGTLLQEYQGDESVAYERLAHADSSRTYISTGLCQEEGYLLFGGFLVEYDYQTGERYYDRFEGLFYQTVEGEICHIPPKECEAYAPAVLALYHLDVFDAPVI